MSVHFSVIITKRISKNIRSVILLLRVCGERTLEFEAKNAARNTRPPMSPRGVLIQTE